MIGRLLGNNTPSYEGQTQTPATPRGGLLSFFMGGFRLFPKAPTYAQPAPPPIETPIPIGGEPAQPDDVPSGGTEAATAGHDPDAEDTPTKRVTIIVTPGPGTTVEDVAAFFRDRCGIDH